MTKIQETTKTTKSTVIYEDTFYMVPRYIRKLCGKNLSYIDVYEAMFQFWNKGRTCFLSNEALAERAGCKIRQVQNALEFFEKNGELRREMRGLRRFLIKPEAKIETNIDYPCDPAQGSTNISQGCSTVHGGVQSSASQGCNPVHVEYKEEIEYIDIHTNKNARAKTQSLAPPEYKETLYPQKSLTEKNEEKLSNDSFDLFFKVYPIQKKENRARAAWFSQRCYLKFEEIMRGLNELILHDAHFKDGYAPSPDTWILEERWKDKPVKRKPRGLEELDHNDDTWARNFHRDIDFADKFK